jgi:hypothetical protein
LLPDHDQLKKADCNETNGKDKNNEPETAFVSP